MRITYVAGDSSASKAVVHDGTAYLGVQIAAAPGPDVADQMRQVLDQVDAALAECGSHKSRMLSATICFADIRHLEQIIAVWDNWVPWHDPPVRTTLEAKLRTPRHLVGVQITAAL
jgi:enamine deaminase RidA (YjgF/YER057c/UK114 family)